MTIQQRPTPLRPQITSWTELDSFIAHRTLDFAADFDESEVAQSVGWTAQQRSKGRVAMLNEVRAAIRPMVADEQAERQQAAAEDPVEAQWREAYSDADELTLRRLGGDR